METPEGGPGNRTLHEPEDLSVRTAPIPLVSRLYRRSNRDRLGPASPHLQTRRSYYQELCQRIQQSTGEALPAPDADPVHVARETDGSIEVITSPESYRDVLDHMQQSGLDPENSEITLRASVDVELDVEAGKKVLEFLDVLEELDDTQAVYSNADIPDEAYE